MLFFTSPNSLRRAGKYFPQIVAMLFLAGFVAWAWTEPTVAPPAGNVEAPINVGSVSQVKAGALGIGGVLEVFSDLIVDGKLGIGTASPGAKLDVQGDIKASSLINLGGVSFPAGGCSVTNRGQQWLFQGGAGIEDGFYICKKKTDGSYDWIALGSPQLITIWDNVRYMTFGVGVPQLISFSVPSDSEYVICSGACYQSSGKISFKYQGNSWFEVPGPYTVPASWSKTIDAEEGGLLEVRMETLFVPMVVNHNVSCYYVK